MKREFIFKGIEYFALIQLVIFVASMLLTGPIDIFCGFIFDVRNMLGRQILRTILFTIVELIALCACFYKKKHNDRYISQKEFLKPLIIAFPLHFILTLINGFYHYTAGGFVSEIGLLWAKWATGIDYFAKSDAPIWPNFILSPIHIAMMFGVICLAYKLGCKKIDKEKREIIGNIQNHSIKEVGFEENNKN